MALHKRFTIDSDVLPQVTACYLRIAGDEVAFIEAHTAHALPRLLAALAEHGKTPEDVKYLVVTHAHLDHAAGASAVLGACKNAKLIAHPRAARNLIEPSKLIAGATHVYGKERFDTLYGTIDPIAEERVIALPDGGTFELGGATFTVLHTAGHAWHHFAVDDPALETVYTGDTFGLVYPALQQGGRFALLTTSPTGFHAGEARKSIDRIVALGRDAACLTHYDEVRDIPEVARQLRAWVDLSEQWVAEGAASSDDGKALESRIEAQIRAAITAKAPASGLVLDDAAWKSLAMDVELNAQGLAYAALDERKKKSGGASATP